MRAFLRRLFGCSQQEFPGRHRPVVDGDTSDSIRVPYPPIRPWQIRDRSFTIRRRGADPAEVSAFLQRIANELAAAHAVAKRARDENIRLRNALAAWQATRLTSVDDLVRR